MCKTGFSIQNHWWKFQKGEGSQNIFSELQYVTKILVTFDSEQVNNKIFDWSVLWMLCFCGVCFLINCGYITTHKHKGANPENNLYQKKIMDMTNK